MAGGISSSLFTAREALRSNLTAINVTGANIANVNTTGYTRLKPVFQTTGAIDVVSTRDQAGVKIADVERVYDRYLEYEIVEKQSSVESYTAQQDLLQRVESVLNENVEGGINDAMNAFFNAWGNLATDPSDKARRDLVVTAGTNLAYLFNQRSEALTNIQFSADDRVAETVSTLNGYLKEMASYNKSISDMESLGGNASTLRDARGNLLSEISKLISINYIEKDDGSLYLYLPADGKALVEGSNVWELQVQRNSSNDNLYDIAFKANSSESINQQISGGMLYGLLDTRDRLLSSYLDSLDQTAASIINKVNEIHGNGYDQDGNPGSLFFNAATDARQMSVTEEITQDSRKIAASATVNADGNNAIALAMIRNDQMYATLGNYATSVPGNGVSGQINNIGQAYKDSTAAIQIGRGATSDSWAVTGAGNGGYSNIRVLSSSDSTVTLSLNGNDTADITLRLSGNWNNGDTVSFSLKKADSTVGIDGYFNSFIAGMGRDLQSATQSLTASKAILTQQMDQREQFSGVSLDEEMMNLIKYQMAYNAAGKLTTTVNEMMNILMNLVQ
ncbi:MAG TPA: flagellar hook-associated protein FlgK [Smithellaceae bacterium]|nr:flagellar hook-associated protein FlgK [Smithellaceae bacterium]HQM45039.1 flagellar hook-associated protein FlgK [Smithellaceae bacterium]